MASRGKNARNYGAVWIQLAHSALTETTQLERMVLENSTPLSALRAAGSGRSCLNVGTPAVGFHFNQQGQRIIHC